MTFHSDMPAFPRPASLDPEFEARIPSQTGMTLRDYFAAKAMQGLITSPHCGKEFSATQKAKIAYIVADEMLKARDGTR